MPVLEIWKAIPGYPGYEVSNLGRVKSLDRIIPQRNGNTIYNRLWKGKISKLRLSRYGHLMTSCGDGTSWGVHQLVAWTFIGQPPPSMVVDHLNGVKTDNRPENLEYVTQSENARRAHANGLMRQSTNEENGSCKISNEGVREIRKLATIWDKKKLAEKFGVSTAQIGNIVSNRQRKLPL